MPRFVDRQGTTWTLQRLTDAHLLGWAALQRALAADGRGMILDPDEVAGTMADARKGCAPFLEDPLRHHALVAESPAGTIGGSCELHRMDRRRIAHVAVLAMGVHPDHQGVGLGRALIEHALLWADAHGVRRVELYCRDDNHRAIRLYESLGFLHEGTRRAFSLDPNGQFVDDRIYGRVL